MQTTGPNPTFCGLHMRAKPCPECGGISQYKIKHRYAKIWQRERFIRE